MTEFPSPLGDCVFNPRQDTGRYRACYVSVPSRGLCFQSDYDVYIRRDYRFVSVPSRGLCFQSSIADNGQFAQFSFRPLSGIVFSIEYSRQWAVRAIQFPSPLGDCVFNLITMFTFAEIIGLFPSPLGDYVFNQIQCKSLLR